MEGAKREFWFSGYEQKCSPTAVRIRVNPDNHDRGIAGLVQLTGELHASVPFAHRIIVPPAVQVLAGPRCKGILTVEMTVAPEFLTRCEAIAQLRTAGYHEDGESIA